MKDCDNCRFEKVIFTDAPCDECRVGDSKWQPVTRYDKILANMTIEQMAEMMTISDYYYDLDYTSINFYRNDTGVHYDYKEAIEAEMEWLNGTDDTPDDETIDA